MVRAYRRRQQVLRAKQHKYTMWPTDSPEEKATVYASSHAEAQRVFADAWNRRVLNQRPGTVRFYISEWQVTGRLESGKR